MDNFNLILVYSKEEDKILMCKREKEPYKEMFNFVGGKVEPNENELNAAYRELQEETGITNKDIVLYNVMNFEYKISKAKIEIYTGKLNKDVVLKEEVNKLYWLNKNEDFFDLNKFAGEGNVGHIIKRVEAYKDKIF